MPSAIDVILSYQDTCAWKDNTMVALLSIFIDQKHLAAELQSFLEQKLIDDESNSVGC